MKKQREQWAISFASFVGNEQTQTLSFNAGTLFRLYKKHITGWYTAYMYTYKDTEEIVTLGYVPDNYISLISLDTAAKKKLQKKNEVDKVLFKKLVTVECHRRFLFDQNHRLSRQCHELSTKLLKYEAAMALSLINRN